MKKFCGLLLIISIFFITGNDCFAFSLNGSGSVYAGSARDYAKFFPQNNYAYRYRRQPKNYIYSAQQAKYYGYRVPQQANTTNNPYYNPYVRGY